MSKVETCYLCGEALGKDVTRDHVPPKQFFPESLREELNPNLTVLPAHYRCNQAFHEDEQYVVHSIGVLCPETNAGKALWTDIGKHYAQSGAKAQALSERIVGEFERRPSGLLLPPGIIGKRFDRRRVCRVAWKIVRGLFFKETQRIVAENTPRTHEVLLDREPPPHFARVRGTTSLGTYPEIFDYKHVEFQDLQAHYWAMLLWSKLIITVIFHDPDCACEKCCATPNPSLDNGDRE